MEFSSKGIGLLAVAGIACVMAGCASYDMDSSEAIGVGTIGAMGVALAAGAPEVAVGIGQAGSHALASAASAGPSTPTARRVDEDDDEDAGEAAAERPLPPMRACNGQRDCYEAALEQYVAAGRGSSPEAQRLRDMIRSLESDTPVFRR